MKPWVKDWGIRRQLHQTHFKALPQYVNGPFLFYPYKSILFIRRNQAKGDKTLSYENIKAYAKALGTTIKSLIVLGDGNDPFYCGTPNHQLWANWLGNYWRSPGMGKCSHIRALHYQLVSQSEPVIMPDGEPYLNTNQCWKKLNNAMKWARYLGIIDPESLDDRRAPAPKLYFPYEWDLQEPSCEIDSPHQPNLESIDFSFPNWEPPPAIAYMEQGHKQAYRLELWCEKSTMNSVLEPLCQQHKMGLQTGVGEISVTRCLELVKRTKLAGKPTRVFYISDFDPAGQSMPVAAARKIEYEISKLDEKLDIKLYPLALTQEQISRYNLPRTPIKETEKRANAFELRHGAGAVELDALEALHPGSLRQIIRTAIAPYLGIERANRRELEVINQANDEAVELANRQAMEEFWETWAELGADADALKQDLEAEARELIARYQARFGQLCDRRAELEQEIEARLSELMPEIATFEPKLLEEEPSALMDSTRSYLTQIKVYKRFQGKEAPEETHIQLAIDCDGELSA
jgi:hypothetical protein